jgi:hypothetical protein
VVASVGLAAGCVGCAGWLGVVVGAVSSFTTTCRIAGAQPMSTCWLAWNAEGGQGVGVWLGWSDGAGAGSVVEVGAGVAGAVVVGVVVGAGTSAAGDDVWATGDRPGVVPPPLPEVPADPAIVGTAV